MTIQFLAPTIARFLYNCSFHSRSAGLASWQPLSRLMMHMGRMSRVKGGTPHCGAGKWARIYGTGVRGSAASGLVP